MYEIKGKFKGVTETIETEIETNKEAKYLLKEYQLAFGRSWDLWISYTSNRS